MFRSSYIRGVLCLALLAPIGAVAESHNRLFVFGDSLSDAGNYYLDTGAVSTRRMLPALAGRRRDTSTDGLDAVA